MNNIPREYRGRHKKILRFIKSFLGSNQYVPTIREIGKGVGINSTSLISRYLDDLEYFGKIRRIRGKTRAIQIVEG